jgi:putative transposase
MDATKITTYKFKLRSSGKSLKPLAAKVNYVWNYCNRTSYKAIRDHRKFLSGFDLQYLVAGTSSLLKLNSQTITAVCRQFANSRNKDKKAKLKPRYATGRNRSLSWIPMSGASFEITHDTLKFMGKSYRFHKSREIEGKIKTGAFVQDAVGDWWLTVTCRIDTKSTGNDLPVGVDLGFKSIAVTSEGEDFVNPKFTQKYAAKLANAQRYRHKKAVARLHRKIARSRADNLHKISRQLVDKYGKIYVGDLRLKKSKSSSDSSYRGLIQMLTYKASRLGQQVHLVPEMGTTVTCSNCLLRSGPQGQSDLGVREWTCVGCGTTHSRDINAAKNILRLGLQLPTKLSRVTTGVVEELL